MPRAAVTRLLICTARCFVTCFSLTSWSPPPTDQQTSAAKGRGSPEAEAPSFYIPSYGYSALMSGMGVLHPDCGTH